MYINTVVTLINFPKNKMLFDMSNVDKTQKRRYDFQLLHFLDYQSEELTKWRLMPKWQRQIWVQILWILLNNMMGFLSGIARYHQIKRGWFDLLSHHLREQGTRNVWFPCSSPNHNPCSVFKKENPPQFTKMWL